MCNNMHMANAFQFPERVSLPNITRAQFEESVRGECQRRGVAMLADFSATCMALAVQIFCDGDRPRGSDTLATYLSSACNVRFKGE